LEFRVHIIELLLVNLCTLVSLKFESWSQDVVLDRESIGGHINILWHLNVVEFLFLSELLHRVLNHCLVICALALDDILHGGASLLSPLFEWLWVYNDNSDGTTFERVSIDHALGDVRRLDEDILKLLWSDILSL